MTLEWLRRKSSVFNDNIGTYLNSSGPITEVEEASLAGAGASGKGERGSGSSSSVLGGAGGKGEGGASGKGGGSGKTEASSGKSYNTSESLGIGSLKGSK